MKKHTQLSENYNIVTLNTLSTILISKFNIHGAIDKEKAKLLANNVKKSFVALENKELQITGENNSTEQKINRSYIKKATITDTTL
ncbi:hypothetical protein SGGMMB4_03420 [Sodalis glossinidius str. 'morsitans']|uniref:Uncharacterized protein n=1 Tax=Sodalis glossinidius (strain morsitans) TaxID=343509 RepID=A0A193QKY2_SODGM|nr:hypothetical protein [Sodalis glossinidius]CRL45585.1 hypothetical protein SGGMMB4_03420 [Sodalis glossinidius str. 'morsitans']